MTVEILEANVDDLDPEMRLQVLWQTLRGFDTPKDSLAAIGALFFRLWENSSLKDEYTFEEFLNRFASLSADVYLTDQVRKQQQEKE